MSPRANGSGRALVCCERVAACHRADTRHDSRTPKGFDHEVVGAQFEAQDLVELSLLALRKRMGTRRPRAGWLGRPRSRRIGIMMSSSTTSGRSAAVELQGLCVRRAPPVAHSLRLLTAPQARPASIVVLGDQDSHDSLPGGVGGVSSVTSNVAPTACPVRAPASVTARQLTHRQPGQCPVPWGPSVTWSPKRRMVEDALAGLGGNAGTAISRRQASWQTAGLGGS